MAALGALLTSACGTWQTDRAHESVPKEVLHLWSDAAPETRSNLETELDADLPGVGKVHIITNVTTPSVTIYRPLNGRTNGTAMLVIPGGSFRALAWDLEGTEVAEWLAARGITAFVLKYRVHPPVEAPSEKRDALAQEARALAIADAAQALRLIRSRASEYKLASGRVGVIGFSAGALITMELAVDASAARRPDFAAAIYGGLPADKHPPEGAPALFLVATQDDRQVPAQESIEIHRKWTKAQRPAELHIYEKGGHGFGMRARGLPVDAWPQSLEAWLVARGGAVARWRGGAAKCGH